MARFNLAYLKNKHFLALAGNGVISLFTLLQMALIYHKLQITEVGCWVFFLGILGIGESIRSGFLSTATIKFYAGTEPNRAKEVLGSVWYLALVITVLLVVVDFALIAALKYISDVEFVVSIKWFGITFISSLPYTLIFWILMADEKYDKILWLRMVNNGSMVLLIVIWVILGKMTLDALLWINLITNLLTNLVCFVFGMSKINTIFNKTKSCLTEIYNFGKYSLGTNLVSNLLRNTDIFIIKFMLGPAAIAIYNIPVKLMEIVEIPLRSFVGTGMSGMSIAYNNNNLERIKYIFSKYAGMLTVAFVPLAVFVGMFANLAVWLLFSSKYNGTEAANLFRIFMICSIMYPIDRFNGATLDVIHKPKINFYKVIVMITANIIGDFIGIYLFNNIYGVVFGALMTVISGLIFGYIQLRKYISYTLWEIPVIGFYEMKLFISNKLNFNNKK